MLPPPAHHVVIDVDYGGRIAEDYAPREGQYLRRRVSVRVERECASACTLVTAVPTARLCFAPGAKLEFHQAYNPNRFDPLDTSYRNEVGTGILMRAYPPALRAWIAGQGGLGPDLMTLQGDALAAIFRICPR